MKKLFSLIAATILITLSFSPVYASDWKINSPFYTSGEFTQTVSSTNKLIVNTSLDNPTGNEYASKLNLIVNKATSGDAYGLRINLTDTASPGSIYPFSISDNSLVVKDGKVGVGISTPTAKLTVAANNDTVYSPISITGGWVVDNAVYWPFDFNDKNGQKRVLIGLSYDNNVDTLLNLTTISTSKFRFIKGGDITQTLVVVDSNGNFGVGIDTPTQKIEVNGGVRLNTATTRPTADSTSVGTLWVTQGGAGAADTLDIVLKSASDTYSWVSIVNGGP